MTERERTVAAFATAVLAAMLRDNRKMGLLQVLNALSALGADARLVNVNEITADEARRLAVKIAANGINETGLHALVTFVDTVDATGGVVSAEDGYLSPAFSPAWGDLGYAYREACKAMGRPMKESEAGDTGEGD